MGKAATALHNYTTGHNKFYVGRIDYIGGNQPFRVVASWGPVNRPKAQAEQTKGEYRTFNEAVNCRDRLVREKTSKGYVDVESAAYREGLTKDHLLRKVDMTRCCEEDGTFKGGMTTTTTAASPPPARPLTSKEMLRGRKIIRGINKPKGK